MVHKVQSNFVYQLDPSDHQRVVMWWRNVGDFTNYMKAVELPYDLYYCFSDDYERVNNGPSDGKKVLMTNDQRFCVSRKYVGEIHKYSMSGEYAGTIMMDEFRRLGGGQHLVGVYGSPYGWPELRGLNIMSMNPQLGFYWDFVKYDAIQPVYIPLRSATLLGDDAYDKLMNGELILKNPDSLLRQKLIESIKKKKLQHEEVSEEDLY